jgi:transposase InsO family protein
MFVVPTIRFQVLYIFIILGLERRGLVLANVTTNPTGEWLAQQVVNAFPWDTAPKFLIRDRDRAYGLAFTARLRGLAIREVRTTVRAPRMNAFAERVIGTLRRECFDHLIVLTNGTPSASLVSFATGTSRTECTWPWGSTRLTIAPQSRLSSPRSSPFGGLHHRYCRRAA